MTSENASFGQDKKISCRTRFPIHFLPFSRKVQELIYSHHESLKFHYLSLDFIREMSGKNMFPNFISDGAVFKSVYYLNSAIINERKHHSEIVPQILMSVRNQTIKDVSTYLHRKKKKTILARFSIYLNRIFQPPAFSRSVDLNDASVLQEWFRYYIRCLWVSVAWSPLQIF